MATVSFSSGTLSEQALRFEISELQAGCFVRKASAKDRRALDPPPVISLKAFRTDRPTNGEEHEIEATDYSDTYCLGWICQVDIFELPRDGALLPVDRFPSTSSEAAQGALARVGDHIVTDGSRCTDQLCGLTFAPAARVLQPGGYRILFVFGDLSVQQDGVFIPRFRCFNVVAPCVGGTRHPALAECFGAPFHVYSSTRCPPLPRSTNLTKHLSLCGIRVNVREGDEESRAKAPSKGGKRKRNL